MITIQLKDYVGEFAENKDVARDLRIQKIIPELDRGETITLDFERVTSATQSFVHALISDLFRKYGLDIIDRLYFKNCSETVQKIISIVVDYMQEAA